MSTQFMIETKTNPISDNKKRIAFVNAIKAFTIFCVVYWHISIYTGTTDSILNTTISLLN